MNYLHWNEMMITDFSEKNVAEMYDRGFVFTRIGKGVMHQTRSVRIDLSRFELSSENRRVLKKVEDIKINTEGILYPASEYDFKIGKLAKDFYQEKFGPGIMSAQKIKEMLTDRTKSNFNALLVYSNSTVESGVVMIGHRLGYAICYSNKNLLHYSYPFYDLSASPKDMGLGMMTMAIQWAKDNGKRYAYLGSLQRPSDAYKLQFAGLEWFDGGPGGSGNWSTDIEAVKGIISQKK